MLPRGSRGLLPALLLWALAACAARASEITFELPDNAKQCFYEEIAQGTKCTLEFQVHRGRRRPGHGGAAAPSPGGCREGLTQLPSCGECLAAAPGKGADAGSNERFPAWLRRTLRERLGGFRVVQGLVGHRVGLKNWQCLYPGRCHIVPHPNSAETT